MEADSVEGADLEVGAVGPGNSTGQPRRRSATYLMEGLFGTGPNLPKKSRSNSSVLTDRRRRRVREVKPRRPSGRSWRWKSI